MEGNLDKIIIITSELFKVLYSVRDQLKLESEKLLFVCVGGLWGIRREEMAVGCGGYDNPQPTAISSRRPVRSAFDE